LLDAVDLVRDRAELYIELKGQRTPGPVVENLRKTGFLDQAVVASFYPWLPQKARLLEPAVRTSVLISWRDRQADYVEWALAVGADYVHPCWERGSPTPHKLLTPEMIAHMRGSGLGIILWHEERPEELRELVKLGVDGICTNTPDLLTTILQESREERKP
jgi:glycerophosphoryl diester phosphodiesterase